MRYISNIIVSIAIGFSLTFFYAFKKSKISAATNEEIIKKSKVKFLMNKVDVIKTGTRRVYSPSSSSSGGHFSGGGHSAGHSSHSSHSSGGGGGHSF